MNTRVLIVVGALLAASIAGVIIGRHRAANHSVLKETAVQLIREGRSGEAVPLLAKALSLKPNYPEAYQALGLALGTLGEADSAEACLRKAIELKPEYPMALYNLALVCERQGRHDEALKLLARAEACGGGYPGARPARARILFAMGKDAIAAGDLDGGERRFAESAAADPKFAEARYGLGKLHHRRGKYREAVSELTLATQMKPGAKVGPALADAYAAIGKERSGAGDYAAAADAYRRAVLLEGADGALRYRLGAALLRRGDIEEGARELEAARRLKAGIEPDGQLVEWLEETGRRARASGDLEKAGMWLDLAACADPRKDLSRERGALSVARGDRAWEGGDAAAAAGHYRDAERAAAGTPGVGEKLARALAAAGERGEAIARYERLRAEDPKNREYPAALGGLYEEAGEFPRAAEAFSSLGSHGRDRLLACYRRWASSEKDPAAAASLYRRCLDLDPRNEELRGEYALSLARAGDCAGALREAGWLLARHPDSAVPAVDPAQIEEFLAARGRGGAAVPRGDLPHQRAHHLQGLVMRECGRSREAGESAREHCRWGLAYHLMEYAEESERELRRSLEIRPEYYEARLILTIVLNRQKRLEEAMREIEQAARLKPGSAVPLNDHAVILAREGKYGEAERILLRAVEVDKRLLTAYGNLQRLYERLGKDVERKFWRFQADRLEDSKDYYEDGLWL